jgi:DnaJ like chaperone protein
MTGMLVCAVVGLLLFRNPWGLLVGLFVGYFIDQSMKPRARARTSSPLEIGERFFKATFEVMGHVAKSDGRVSESEIAAARKVMAEYQFSGAQIHAAIGHFTRGKDANFDVEATVQEFAQTCMHEPNLLRAFLEIQVRAALEGVDMQGPARTAIQRVAELLDISRLELAHMEAVLRIRREHFRQQSRGGSAGGTTPPPSGAQLASAYQVLEVDPKAPDAEVAKAYRRQLSKHHPDKLKANGLPESMLEHAKQRTQQIIEAYELIKATRNK